MTETKKSWSIYRRLTQWFALWTLGLLVLVFAVTGWYVTQSVNRELNALTHEELDEMCAIFPSSDQTRESFAEIAAVLDELHPANRMAWRVWNPETGEVWAEHGYLPLLDSVVPGATAGQTYKPGKTLRWRVARMRGDPPLDQFLVGLALDSSSQMAFVRRYGFVALGILGLCAVLSIVGAALFGRRISNQLHRVAENARAVRGPTAGFSVDMRDAPEEIREVASALSEMLGNIRKETERAQLLTSGIAHELRSPIQNLLGETEVTLLRERDPGEYRRVLESHIEELRDLGRAVDNLVTLCSPSEQGGHELERFDLARETDLRLHKEHSTAAREQVQLEMNSSGDLNFRGDREALLLALRNLVGNAIHWSPRGGTVRVNLEGQPDAVEITVDDSGPGVSRELREKIFEPFTQGPASRGSRVGYGLGLALTRTAVEAHGGSIEVGTSPEGGARFRIALPRSA